MKVYTIWCEWDMGFEENVYSTKEKAEQAIDEMDWEGRVEMTLEDVKELEYVGIEPKNLI